MDQNNLALKHLNAYLLLLKQQDSRMQKLLQLEYFDEASLLAFVSYTREYSDLWEEYQSWLNIILTQVAQTPEVQQATEHIERLHNSLLASSKLLKEKIKLYQESLIKLIENTKMERKVTPRYKYASANHVLNINA